MHQRRKYHHTPLPEVAKGIVLNLLKLILPLGQTQPNSSCAMTVNSKVPVEGIAKLKCSTAILRPLKIHLKHLF